MGRSRAGVRRGGVRRGTGRASPGEDDARRASKEEEKEELRQRQQASYYGEEFAGAPAIAGEPYDRFTAAHSYCRSVPSLR